MLQAISVGRGDGVDVSIDDDTVSRLHAEIVSAGENRFYITDCMSTSGTFVGRDGAWQQIKQEYVDIGEAILLGNYQTTVGWRQSIWRKWFIYELQPAISFHRQYDYEPNYMLRLNLNFYFGNI